MAESRRKVVDIEVGKSRVLWFKYAAEHKWDDDIRDLGWRDLERCIRAANARKAKVRKHDDARTLLKGDL